MQSGTTAGIAVAKNLEAAGRADKSAWPAKLGWSLAGWTIFVLAWHLVTLHNKISDIPTPMQTWAALAEILEQGVLWKNVVASVFRVAWGFAIAALVGIPLGILMGWYPLSRKLLNPVVQGLRPISPIAWLPIAVTLFGGSDWLIDASDKSAIFLIFLSSFFPIVTATTAAVATIERKFLRSAANFGVTGLDLFRRVILPAAMPQILTGLRLALGIAWVVVVAAEMLGVSSGLGFQVNDARNMLRNDWVTAAMVIIALIGLALDYGISSITSATLARRGVDQR
ncbi:MAG: ABC transporter permease [Planctomycetes bacterium]|nr:ABC transporter permease [Planctomycetota bacterium]MCC7169626.1 ABC transporter permease [Planctomycetota bacterium]